VEALVRWLHPERGLTMPDEFIETAESTGVIVPMGRWVLEQACADLARLNEELPPHAQPLYVTVNLSGRQFQEPTIVSDLAEIIADSRVTASSVVLELTETVLMDDIDDGMERLQALRGLGVRLALDDFGTGYSSLSYLRRMPMDILKVDRSFITALDTAEGPGMVRSILRLGDTFRLATLAEGIETPEQLAMLRALGCTYGQGYLFAAPLARHQITAMVGAARETKEPVALFG
jgi:EAL domain-containing protein (putative c-di-GMP-specific phosphodiesterase class I)